MPKKQITIAGEWVPSAPQVKLAEELSRGLSLLKACEKAGVPYRTAHRWYYNPGIPEFHAYIAWVSEQLAASYEPRFNRLISTALDIEQAVLNGEVKADAGPGQRAHDILRATAYRIAALRALDQGALPGPGAQHRALPPGQ